MWHDDSETNQDRIARAEQLVDSASDCHLIVLPELWYVGVWSYDVYWESSESVAGEIASRFAEKAKKLGAYILAGSIIERDGDSLYNTAVLLDPKGKILVTTERDMEPELRRYQLNTSPTGIHSLLYYAAMFVGDSQTMTSEAAVLGTPAIRCNSFVGRITYLEEEEHKYKLTFGFKPGLFEQMVRKIGELSAMPDIKGEWQNRRRQMLKDKIDVTRFITDFVEKYPDGTNR